uniref:C-type lectin domain-containing protein n=1 Tax=Panagrolaimus davidi TaxID=227884 RepID=A0A914PY35_9BILA
MFLNGKANKAFADVSSDTYWIGATDTIKPQTWSWLDNSSLAFNNWVKGQPQNTFDSNCGAGLMQGGKWISDNCNKQKPFICEFKTIKDTTTTTTHPKPTSCQPSWTYYVVNGTTGYCYKVFNNATWIDAENNCIVDGAHLASIHTLDEALFLAYLAYWPGADVCDVYKMAWIGGHTDDNNAHWYWTDGTPFNYTTWRSGGRPTSSLPRSCTLKYLTTQCQQPASTIDNWSCERLLAKYICKKSPE